MIRTQVKQTLQTACQIRQLHKIRNKTRSNKEIQLIVEESGE